MGELPGVSKVTGIISNLRSYWSQRNSKFRDWYEILVLIDQLETKGMETYVSNDPQTFYNMAHFLLTNGELKHSIPVENESVMELDKRAKMGRACDYLWKTINRERQMSGSQPFIDDLAFFILVLGWHSEVIKYDQNSGLLKVQIWNPYDVYPSYSNGHISVCVHSYSVSEEEAGQKAQANGWDYVPRNPTPGGSNNVTLDDFFLYTNEGLYNMILLNSKDVTGWQLRSDMEILVAPVGGFPDRGSLASGTSGRPTRDWRRLAGRGIFEVNEAVLESFNKWKSMVAQILRDTAQGVTEEFSATPQATPEELRERGALFHYAPGEQGLVRVPPPTIPMEVQSHLLQMQRELQKGSFSDLVHGMLEGSGGSQAGYGITLLANASANQILYPYMEAKHFIIGECDRFWLSHLKQDGKSFSIKGKFLEKIEAKDIPEEVFIDVSSEVATPQDWLQRGTIANLLKDHLDESTIITQVLKMGDPQAIKRARSLDRMLNNPMSQLVEQISGYYAHADYLDATGDSKQAALFRRAAKALESQLGAPAPGQGRPQDMQRIQSQRIAGAPQETVPVNSNVAPPETGAFTPAQLRGAIGRGTVRVP